LKAATTEMEAAAQAGSPAQMRTARQELKAAHMHADAVHADTVGVIQSDGLAGAIIRAHSKLIEYHGKAGYDALGNVPKIVIGNAIVKNALLDPETRELVLYLAKNHPRPSVAKAEKDGWEAPSRYIYAYYDTAKFSKFLVPDATSSKGMTENHAFVGLCKEREHAEKVGPLQGRGLDCACDPCLLFKFDDCEMKAVVGKMHRVTTPLPRGAPLRRPQLQSLQDWSDTLVAKMVGSERLYCCPSVHSSHGCLSLLASQIVAVLADADERHIEGAYWLAVLTGPAFVIPEDCMHSGQPYREGWLVAPGKWYSLRQRSERGYELLSQEVWIVVNHMIRLKGIQFRGSQAGPQEREFRDSGFCHRPVCCDACCWIWLVVSM
jgi:hypothetical protein